MRAVANSVHNLRRLAWTQEEMADGGSDRLVDALVAWGDLDAVRSRVGAHLAVGADHVCVQVLEGDGAGSTLEQLGPIASLLGEDLRG